MSATPQDRPRDALPTGTVTFVFTDIEGSTERWDRNRSAMQAAVRRHDELMRAAIAEHDGVVFKTIGDAFCAAFARPEDAVAAALEAQRNLAAGDFSAVDGLRVRAAIHTGTADERDGDYFGPAVNRVARLLAIGHGGQVLVSGVTSDLVQGALPSQTTLRDLGEHRLRDLSRPEYVYQLLAPELAAEFPPLRSLDVLPNNLPLQLTSFIGRETEIAEITALIAEHRLVTIVGSGGVGKTRTSLQVAANLLDGSGDGVWFIELAPLGSADYIPSTVAQALGLTLPLEGDRIENLARALHRKHALLVFDNCEHLVEPAARVIAAILSGCPKVKILASSRQGLGVRGEETYRMPSLDVPREGEAGVDGMQTIRSAAIALFVERARSADKKFTLTDENAPVIADICRRLDGIPLAIELAASRVKMFSAKQVLERLDERFRMLTGGSRDVLPRQQTLRALIDWSHDLLDNRERLLFRRLGIFVNGFTYEGAVAVGSGEDLDEFELFDALGSLVDKSLVLAEPQADAVRYRLLESTRAYASEKLAEAGELDFAAASHLGYLRDRFADLWRQTVRTARPTDLSTALTTELEDIRFALDGAFARSAIIEGGTLLASLSALWTNLGLDTEAVRRWEQYIAALPGDQKLLLASLSSSFAFLLNESGQSPRALVVATEGVAHARLSGDAATLSSSLSRLGEVLLKLRRADDAEAALAEAEAIPEAPAAVRLNLLGSRANLSSLRGDARAAARVHEQLRKDARSRGDVRGEIVAALNLAELENAAGQTQRAIAIVYEVLPALRSGKAKITLASTLANLAGYLAAIDNFTDALSAGREAISILAALESGHVHIAVAIEHLALVHALHGSLARAATEEGYVDAVFRRNGFEREVTETMTYDRLTALLREGLTPGEFDRLLAEGAALTPEAAIALALEESTS
jgi:predicted ATPase/class 3 adenylate cyclase